LTSIVIHTEDADETIRFGEKLGAALKPGDVVALTGELGAGKTTITRGIARGVGVEAEIHSPTFTLIHEHPGRLPLYHIDLYRIEVEDATADLGLEEYLYGNGVTVIEWAERLIGVLPDNALLVRLTVADDEERDIKLSATAARWAEPLKDLADANTGH
jgi:tRNA threonylcarbamoyladenosine biosynthesis protein TsaE